MTSFTPAAALAGGALIGLAAAVLMLVNGRVAGISGILGGLLNPADRDPRWRIAFLVGLVVAPWLYPLIGGALPDTRPVAGIPVLIAAGVLVGVGTRLGGGCTSGHGVCGVARLSARSAMATATFMAAAIVTVFVVRHVIGG